jgi:hypothetical protein
MNFVIDRNRTQVLSEEIKKEVENSHWWISGRNAPSIEMTDDAKRGGYLQIPL